MSAPKIIRVNGVRYMRKDAYEGAGQPIGIKVGDVQYVRVEAAHPIEDTEGIPLSDIVKKSEPAVQKALKDSRDMYFTQKGGDKKKPKETGINPDRNGPPPHADGAGDGDGGDGGGDGGGGA